jgi:hypothetical protein
MIPLAASGTVVISVSVVGALALLAILLRAENRAVAREKRERDGAKERDRGV